MQLARILFSIGLALVVASWPSAAEAQFDAATVLGRVLDESGGAMPGANVTLTSKTTNIAVSTTTDDTGSYQFLNVRVGEYTIDAQLQGFAGVKSDVTVTVGARQRVDLSLKVGGIGESIEVSGAPRVLETESSDRGQVIAHEQIVNLPLNGRAYADLALLSPGVRPSAISTSRDASFNVNGMRSAARSTTSSSTASTTTPTAPATRASRTRSCRCRPMRSRSSRSSPTTSARSTAAPAAP
jgi:hypothetical protein